jgi:hypothetical protein
LGRDRPATAKWGAFSTFCRCRPACLAIPRPRSLTLTR